MALAYKIFVVGTEQDVPVYEFVEKHPDIFIFGYDFFMIEGFSKRIEGLKQGDTFDFTLTPDEAFGEKDPMLVLPLDKTLFHNADGEFDAERVALGQYVPMTLSNGQRAEGLVVDSMTGQDAVNTAKEFNDRLNFDGVVLTKLDGDTRGGAALSIRTVVTKPIKFVGTGEKMEALDVFHPSRMADRILGMGDIVSLVERAQEQFDEEEAKK